MSLLATPVVVGQRSAPSRLLFGPHETNLCDGRALSDRHVAYYARRAAGGVGIIVTETASVTANDWPYERAPLASECRKGWRAVAEACGPHSTLILAGLGHAGGQGSSAYSQEVMWAPSAVADVVSREPPAVLDPGGIARLVRAYATAATFATGAGLAGVEIDAGAWSLLRQFHSGLTNLREDEYGADRLLFTRQVLESVRRSIGPDAVLALRLSCDELAPWAGVTPDHAEAMVAELAPMVDLLTVVRAGPFSTGAYRPDAHAEPGFNRELCRRMRAAAGVTPVVLQGSVVERSMADEALESGVCDLVEMTRALIADASLLTSERPRPCLLCNQECQVRDPRNPIVTCVVDPPVEAGASPGPPVLVVGGGPAGMECARVLASAGRPVRLTERSGALGGTLATAAVGPGRERLRAATDWLVAEIRALGVEIELGHEVTAEEAASWRGPIVLATGSRFVDGRYPNAGVPVLDPLQVLADPAVLPEGPIAVLDPVGNAVAVNLAEWLASSHGRTVTLITPDPVAGTQLARTGDLADANGRLQRAGVARQLRSVVRAVTADGVTVEDCWTGAPALVPAASVVDCGHRLPADDLYASLDDITVARAGDCVAPRTLLEAVLEGRRIGSRT